MSDRNEQIIAAVKSGMTYDEAAAEFKVTRNVVAGICHRAGVKVGDQPGRRDRMLYALGETRAARKRWWDELPEPEKAERMRRAAEASLAAATARRRQSWEAAPSRSKRRAWWEGLSEEERQALMGTVGTSE